VNDFRVSVDISQLDEEVPKQPTVFFFRLHPVEASMPIKGVRNRFIWLLGNGS
jgi:hypothetical protein